jgi:hypothetical protein
VEADADFDAVARFGVRDGDARWDLSSMYHAPVLALDPGSEPRPDGSASDNAAARRRGRLHDLIDGTEYQALIELSSGPYWPSATQALAFANEIPGSLSGSQRRQIQGYIRPHPAAGDMANRHVRRHLAPSGHASEVPPKQ